MISIRYDRLSESDEKELAKLFLSDGFKVLSKILESKKDAILVTTLKDAAEAAEFDGKQAQLNADLREANKIQTCIIVLEEIRKDREPKLAKIT